jgi:L,D-peptidoglycan transpeptidase YkuD (ErfK/YbiS/YcfS/YnhG family)
MTPRVLAIPTTLMCTVALAATALPLGRATVEPAAPPATSIRPAVATTTEAAAGGTLADRVDVPARTRQLVTITSRGGWDAKHAWLRAFRRTGDDWMRVRSKIRVRLGYGGWVPAKRRVQSTGTTPAGTFRLPYAFGRLADPGTSLRYRRFDGNDWWPYEPRDPATYNIYQPRKAAGTRWRRDKAERLADYPWQYAYAVVVGFNLPSGIHYSKARRQWVAKDRADTDRGGGIFLHVNGDGLTAGCVSMRKAQMRWLVRWLRPGTAPRVVMGPRRFVA